MIAWRFYVNQLQRIFSYRAEFWLGFLGTMISQVAVAYFLWKAIFRVRGVDALQGYTFAGLMLYYLLVPLVERIVHVQEMAGFSGEIYDGGLTRYLLYPVSYFRIKYAGILGLSTVHLAQLAVILIGYVLIAGRPDGMTAAALLRGLAALWAASTLSFFLSAAVEMVAFWADNVWSLWIMVRMAVSLLGGGMIPLAFFPDGVRAALEWLPFSRLIAFPIRCLTAPVPWTEWAGGMALTLAWAALFGALAALLWKRGLRSYAGVGI